MQTQYTITAGNITWSERANDWISQTCYPTQLAAARAALRVEKHLHIIATSLGPFEDGTFAVTTSYRPDSRQN